MVCESTTSSIGTSREGRIVAESCPVSGVLREDFLVTVSDGTELAVMVHRPSGGGSYPALLTRTAYGMNNPDMPFIGDSIAAAQRGYIAVVQDVRGRYESGGTFSLGSGEARDAFDTIDWIVGQEWCDGAIGLVGTSYHGLTAMLAAQSCHPAVRTAVVNVSGGPFDGLIHYAPGIAQPEVMVGWVVQHILPDMTRRVGALVEDKDLLALMDPSVSDELVAFVNDPANQDPDNAEKASEVLASIHRKMASSFQPLMSRSPFEIIELISKYAPWVKDWARFPDPEDHFWSDIDYTRKLGELDIPVLYLGGWHDLFARGTVRNFVETQRGGGQNRLVMSGCKHIPMQDIGDWRLPDPPKWDPLNLGLGGVSFAGAEGEITGWLDVHLKDSSDPFATARAATPVSLYVQRADTWRDESGWPLVNTEWTTLYIEGDGSSTSGGHLATQKGRSGVTEYDYDPANAVPSLGGTALDSHVRAGIFRQMTIESRDDVLIYTTQRFDDAIEITGPISVELYVSSTAVDTDFFVRLTDVDPAGNSTNITDGVTRLQYRNGRFETYEPNCIVKLNVELSPTSYLLASGHAVRLQVTSSSFPLLFPNPNLGVNYLVESVTPIKARQTVHYGEGHPSSITIPVIPN